MNLLSLFKKKYLPLNKIEISEKALLSNYYYLSRLSDELIVAPVLKSNAYGHGLQLVGKILDNVGAPFFCVDSLYEAYELLKIKIKTRILIMGYTEPENLKVKQLPFSYAVYDEAVIATLSKYQENPAVHIFVDTGMHREGIDLADLPEFLEYIKHFKNIRVEGLMSHLGAGDNITTTKKQLAQFDLAKDIVTASGFFPAWFHIAASAGLLHNGDYENRLGNLARSGIAIYGIDLEKKNDLLQPVLTFKTILNQIKFLKKGEKVGYDFTFRAPRDMTIGVLPAGYSDGIDRRLSNKGCVFINNIFCPILGRVSMNLISVDISGVENPQVGDSVVVYSNNSSHKNSLFNAAKLIDDIPYELLVHLLASTKRVTV